MDMRQIAVLGGILVVLSVASISLDALSRGEYAEADTIADNVRTFEELAGRFEDLAKKRGAVYGFEILGRAKLPADTDLHLLGHTIGDQLYLQRGIAGMADCTQDFRNACSHSVVIGALNEFGDGAEVLEMIRAACKAAPGGSGAYTMCFHGLGHGVFAYYGYDLSQTVDFCRAGGTEEFRDREFIECVGGAIMELMGGGGHDPESWKKARAKYLTEDPLSPCMDSVPEEARSLCLTYLTPRLLELAGADLAKPDPVLFPKAFGYCDVIAHEEWREACWGGFGKEFVPIAGSRDIRAIDHMSDTSYALAIEWCRSAENPLAEKACIGEALNSIFWGGENDPEGSFRFCSLIDDGPLQDHCYAELATGIWTYTFGDTRTELCSRLPEPHSGCAKEMSL